MAARTPGEALFGSIFDMRGMVFPPLEAHFITSGPEMSNRFWLFKRIGFGYTRLNTKPIDFRAQIVYNSIRK